MLHKIVSDILIIVKSFKFKVAFSFQLLASLFRFHMARLKRQHLMSASTLEVITFLIRYRGRTSIKQELLRLNVNFRNIIYLQIFFPQGHIKHWQGTKKTISMIFFSLSSARPSPSLFQKPLQPSDHIQASPVREDPVRDKCCSPHFRQKN